MPITIGRNIHSLQAQRRLSESTSSLSRSFERLSSGLRINRASDDAAGLAISKDLATRARVYTQAIRNGNDGQSVLAIADSAIENLTSIVTRIGELAAQSANGSYSAEQREALDSEAQALAAEFFRISRSTSYNGIKLFDGSLGDGLRIQLGYGVNGSINAGVGGSLGTGTFGGATSYAAESSTSQAVALGDINGDGILDLVTGGYTDGPEQGFATVRLGTGSGTFGSATSFATIGYATLGLTLGDVNSDGVLDLVTAGISDSPFDGVVTVHIGNGNGTFGAAVSYRGEERFSNAVTLGDLNGDGNLDLVTTGIDESTNGFTTVRLGNGNGTFGSATSYAAENNGSNAVALEDLNGDGVLDLVTAGRHDSNFGYASVRLGTGSGTFGAATTYTTESGFSRGLTLGDVNNDGIADLITTGQGSGGEVTLRLGTGTGTFGAAVSIVTDLDESLAVRLGDFNGDGNADILIAGNTGADGYGSVKLGNGRGTFGSSVTFTTDGEASNAVTIGDLNGDGVLDVVTSGNNDSSDGTATVRLGNSRNGIAPLLEFSLKTQADALQSIGQLNRALSNLATQRGVIGAFQSRISSALNTLTGKTENLAAAASRIESVDVAEESALLIRTQIRQQATTAILAQANQNPALAVQLLR